MGNPPVHIYRPVLILSRKARYILAVSAACIALAVYTFFDPSSGWFPPCPFRAVTGLLCPGCGSQRAVHALLNADIASAWGYNPAFVLSLPLLAVLTMSVPFSPLKRLRRSVWLPRVVLAAIVAWWVGRNLI